MSASASMPAMRALSVQSRDAVSALRAAIDELLAAGGELVICGSHHLVGHLRAALLGAEADARWLGDPLTRG